MRLLSFIAIFFYFRLTFNIHVEDEPPNGFGSMIFYLTNRHPNDYNLYGCWCNTNASVNDQYKTIDDIDVCCKVQLQCYENINDMNVSCTDDKKYHTIYYDNQVQCVDNDETTNHNLCLCDKQTAECFKRTLLMYDQNNRNLNVSNTCGQDHLAPIFNWNPVATTIAGISGKAGTKSNMLHMPYALILVENDALYVSDQNTHRVQKFIIDDLNGKTVAGQINGQSGSDSFHLSRPGGILIDSNRNLYVAGINNHRIQLWPEDSSTSRTIAGVTGISGSSNSLFHSPYGIARDPKTRTIYVADRDNHRIIGYVINSSVGVIVGGGNGPGTSANQLFFPIAIHFDSSTESLIIANYGAHNIVRWKLGAKNWTLVAGSKDGRNGSTSALLNAPIDVTLDRWNNVYVADTSNHRIQFFPAGQMEGITIAGVTNSAGSSSTHLHYPFSLRLDSQLNLYVADTYNHRIQKFILY